MTLASTTSKVQYNGNGSTTAFPFSFKFTAANEIEVILTSSAGVDAVKAITTHYTLSSPGDSGTVTMITAPASGEVLTIRRIMPLTQTTDLNAGGGFSAATIEAALDKLAMIGQQLLEKIRRAAKFRDGSTSAEVTLPDPEANAILGWNADADDLVNVQVLSSDNIALPTTSTDNGVPRFDGTDANALQGSAATISDDGAIAVGDGTAALPAFTFTSDPDTGVLRNGANGLGFSTGGSLRAHVDSSGRLIVNAAGAVAGTSSITPYLQAISTSADASAALLGRFSNDADPSALQMVKSRNTGTGGHTIVQSADVLGRVIFGGSDGTDFEIAAQIQGAVDGTPGNNDMPGRLVFSTTADGAASPTERMRIDSQSRVTIGASGAAVTGLYTESPCLQALGTLGNSQILMGAYRSDTNGGALELVKSRSDTVGTHAIVQSGDSLGNVAWGGSDGTIFREAARVSAAVDGTPGSGDMPGRMVFSTTADGASSPAEALRIDNAGEILSSRGGIGYRTGAGGAVTQLTSKSTGVTLNTLSGTITMNNASLSAGAGVTFTLSNNKVGADDVVVVNKGAGGTSGVYEVKVLDTVAGAVNIRVTNLSGGALGEAIPIKFMVLRTATS